MKRKKGTILKGVPDIEPYKVSGSGKKAKVPVNQYDLSGHYIQTFESMLEASKITKARYTGISACCIGDSMSAGGFQWRRYESK